MSVGWVGEEKFSLCSQSSLNVLLAINVLLTSVDYTNVTCKSGVRDQIVARTENVNGTQTEKEVTQLAALQKGNSSDNTLLGTNWKSLKLEFPPNGPGSDTYRTKMTMQLRTSLFIAVPPITKHTLVSFI